MRLSSRSMKKASRKPPTQHTAESRTSHIPAYSVGMMTSVDARTMPKMPWEAMA